MTKLGVFPASYHPVYEAIASKLLKRGKVFADLTGFHYKSYDGFLLGQTWFGSGKRYVCIPDIPFIFHE
jgi:hypothetical protein